MFSIEIKINGSMIGHIYGRNIGNTGAKDQYIYEYYEPELRKVISGNVNHKRSNGIRELLAVILKDIKQREPN